MFWVGQIDGALQMFARFGVVALQVEGRTERGLRAVRISIER